MDEIAITLPVDAVERLVELATLALKYAPVSEWDGRDRKAIRLVAEELDQIERMTGGTNGPQTQDQA